MARAVQAPALTPSEYFQTVLAPGWHVAFSDSSGVGHDSVASCGRYGIVAEFPTERSVKVRMLSQSPGDGAIWRLGAEATYPLSCVSRAGLIFKAHGVCSRYSILPLDAQVVCCGNTQDARAQRVLRAIREWPSQPAVPLKLASAACPWPITVVTPLAAAAEHSGHNVSLGNTSCVSTSTGLRLILDELVPRFWIGVSHRCSTCQSPVAWPQLSDVQAYFPSSKICRTGNTWYTVSFLLSTAMHFVLEMCEAKLRVWLAERWSWAAYSDRKEHLHKGLSIFRTPGDEAVDDMGNVAGEDVVGEVPWLLSGAEPRAFHFCVCAAGLTHSSTNQHSMFVPNPFSQTSARDAIGELMFKNGPRCGFFFCTGLVSFGRVAAPSPRPQSSSAQKVIQHENTKLIVCFITYLPCSSLFSLFSLSLSLQRGMG